MKGKRIARKTSKPFRTGQLNRFVDDIIHPFFQENKNLIWIDGIAHMLIENIPKLSAEKFAKYDIPQLMKKKRKNTCKR